MGFELILIVMLIGIIVGMVIAASLNRPNIYR
jgi:hypothetical protein